ncbi:MAG: hypothetical protein P4N60_03915 [Verrucomicrobiae bacterium]|nr:hypothetical protein [Verrucomicrobiae bacterium]
MKTFNVKTAVRAFGVLLVLDALLFTLLFQVPSDWSRSLWWLFNCFGYRLGDLAGRCLVHQGFVFHDYTLLAVIGLVCTLIWSALFGFVFHRRAAA